MSRSMPWGGYHAAARIDTRPPYFLWNSIPWLGIALLKLGPLTIEFNWPVAFDAEAEDDE